LPLWNYTHLQGPPGMPVRIPQGGAPTSKYIVVVGKFINPRNIQASAEHWKIDAQLADGRTIKAELLAPPNKIVISYPSGKQPDVLEPDRYGSHAARENAGHRWSVSLGPTSVLRLGRAVRAGHVVDRGELVSVCDRRVGHWSVDHPDAD